jgi:hypothetical protein
MRTRIAAISLALLFILTSGCAIVHQYGPYYGKVADAETKEPLEGAAVLVGCYTQSYGPGGSNDNYVDAQETVTDKNGEFRIPAFTIWTFRPLQNFASYVDFTIFKPGYGDFPRHARSKINSESPKSWLLSTNDYMAIELSKLKPGEMFSSPSVNFDIPYKKQIKFIEILNLWKEQIGSDKYTEKSFERR